MRTERDSVGEMQVEDKKYYGIHTMRALENFHISGQSMHPLLVQMLVWIKKAAAMVNREAGALDAKIADAIAAACDDAIAGELDDQFPVDAIQGGAGTSANMNVNEVIANRALERLGLARGRYDVVHPNDHVNMCQSTNDVYPSAGRMALSVLLERTALQMEMLSGAMQAKATRYADVVKLGRTQLQDAVPVRYGQCFQAWAVAFRRDAERLRGAASDMRALSLGGTAVGTCVNTSKTYRDKILPTLSRITGMPLRGVDNLMDATQNLDAYVCVSGALKACAVNMTKIANDLRLLSSGPCGGLGELKLPPRQNGSSIMPGKVNPVIPEVVDQVAFRVMGNDTTVTLAAQSGQLELNAFEPVLFSALFESCEWTEHAATTLRKYCVDGLEVDEERCRQLLQLSASTATALSPYIGYACAAKLAKEAVATHMSVFQLALQETSLTRDQLEHVMDCRAMTGV